MTLHESAMQAGPRFARARPPAWWWGPVAVGVVALVLAALAFMVFSGVGRMSQGAFVWKCQTLITTRMNASMTRFVPPVPLDLIGTPESGLTYVGQVATGNTAGALNRTDFTCSYNPLTRMVSTELQH